MRRAWPMRAGPGVREEGKRLEGTRYNCIRFSVSLLQKVINFVILVRKVLEYVLSLLRTCTGCLIRKSAGKRQGLKFDGNLRPFEPDDADDDVTHGVPKVSCRHEHRISQPASGLSQRSCRNVML